MSWSADDLKSVGGMWRGTPRVRVRNAAELGCPKQLLAQGKNDSWNRVIWTDAGFDSLSPFLTAEFRIPADDSLVGKSLQLHTTLAIEFPAPQGRSSYGDQRMTVNRFDEVMLASRSVKQSYWNSWSSGATIGMATTIVGGLLLVIFALGVSGSPPPIPSSRGAGLWQTADTLSYGR